MRIISAQTNNQQSTALPLLGEGTTNEETMNYIIRVPAYPIGKQLLQDEIDRIMIKLDASHYIVGYFAQYEYSIEYKVLFLVNQ